MHAVAICGSPRKKGNTELLLRLCLDTLAAHGIPGELIRLGGKTIKGCTACGWCRKEQNGTCVQKDDDFHPVLAAMREADILVVGSPVYFGSAAPELMALLDRAGYVARGSGQFFSRKLGGAVVVARRAGQNFTFAQLVYWFLINDMIVPGSTYWNIGVGGPAGAVSEDQEALATVKRFAENLAWLAKRTTTPSVSPPSS